VPLLFVSQHPPFNSPRDSIERAKEGVNAMSQASLIPTFSAYDEPVETVWYSFEVDGVTRRCFVQALAAGLLITTVASRSQAQERARQGFGGPGQTGGREARQLAVGQRVHIAKDGAITVMTGKVEGGQGPSSRRRRRRNCASHPSV
jgi:hypothetical protein